LRASLTVQNRRPLKKKPSNTKIAVDMMEKVRENMRPAMTAVIMHRL
jgi:cytochrome c-type biogenesis protein CcmH/NrfF